MRDVICPRHHQVLAMCQIWHWRSRRVRPVLAGWPDAGTGDGEGAATARCGRNPARR